jgi:hypothetical protein
MEESELSGIEVWIDELAAMAIKNRARIKVEKAIADKIMEKNGHRFTKEVTQLITLPEIRQIVMEKMAEKIIEEWRNK